MRLAHLADLHLGRVFHANSLVEDQAHALAQALDVMRREGVDAVLLAGDLYDRALPGREAVRLLDWFLREVNESLGLPVVAIAGNHDSADHLGFGAWMFRRENLHVRGRMDPDAPPVRFADAHGAVDIYPLPYVEPEAAREWLVAEGDADADPDDGLDWGDDDDDGDDSAAGAGGLKEQVREATVRLEREMIVRALAQTGHNVTQTARLLKISRKSLQIKMKELGLRETT